MAPEIHDIDHIFPIFARHHATLLGNSQGLGQSERLAQSTNLYPYLAPFLEQTMIYYASYKAISSGLIT